MRRVFALMFLLVACVPLCSCVPEPAFAEKPKVLWSSEAVDLPEVSVSQEPPLFDPSPYVFPVRARGHRLISGRYVPADPPPSCSAVSVGGGELITTKHLLDSLHGKIEIDIEIDGAWLNNAPYSVAPDRDALRIKTDRDLPSAEVRKPVYREEVVAYGLTSCRSLGGLYCGILSTGRPESFVSLDPGEEGVDPGDSGGGVFGQDGKLIGLIQGYGAERKNVATVLVADMANYVPPVAAAQKPPGVVCKNGQCFRNSPSGMVYRFPDPRRR